MLLLVAFVLEVFSVAKGDDDEIINQVRIERVVTEVKSNWLQQGIIDDKLEQLAEAKRSRSGEAKEPKPEETFLSGVTFQEMVQLVEELPGKNFYLYLGIASSMDRFKQLKPEDARRELKALVKMIPLRDPDEISSAFFDGMKTSAEVMSLAKRLYNSDSQEEKKELLLKMFTATLEGSQAVKREKMSV